MSTPRLLLVGSGHAHLEVIRSMRDGHWPARCALVSPSPAQFYSGMVPGYLQGTYGRDEIQLDVAGLCARAGVELIEATALAVDAGRRVVSTDAGDLEFDYASLDVGSAPAGTELPGVGEHALALRPMDRAVALRARIDELALKASRGPRVVRLAVVGAGAAGVEVALALERRVAMRGSGASVTLLESGPRVLPGYSDRVCAQAEAVLASRGIVIATGSAVVSVDATGVTLASGARREADAVVWTTGPAPPPLLASSTLPLSPDGYFAVDACLRARDDAAIWGAGDCVDVEDWDLPKAGVYAVREGPVLTHNLRAALGEGEPTPYRPQKSFLSLLNTADGKALLRWKGLASHSRLAWWLKDAIDRRFLQRHQP